MLYFSKLKLVSIYFVIVFLSFLSLANFFENEDNILLSKKVNLGLDLQGGSYLLLEVDLQPVLKQRLQDKVILIRKALKKQHKDKKNMTKYIVNNLIFEKYNTKYNYFFVVGLLNKLCIVD